MCYDFFPLVLYFEDYNVTQIDRKYQSLSLCLFKYVQLPPLVKELSIHLFSPQLFTDHLECVPGTMNTISNGFGINFWSDQLA